MDIAASTSHLVSPTGISAQAQRASVACAAAALPSTDLSSTTMPTFHDGHPPRSPESSTSELAATSPPRAEVSRRVRYNSRRARNSKRPRPLRTTIICRLHAVSNRRRAETQEINSRPYELSRQAASLEPESGPIASLVEVRGSWKRRSRKLFSEGSGILPRLEARLRATNDLEATSPLQHTRSF